MITFPDVSNHQSAGGVALPLDGATACMAKATEGIGYTDTLYAHFLGDARRLGIPFAGYHYLRNDSPAAAQARYAFSVVGPNVPLMVDVEVVQGSTDPTEDDVASFIDAYRAAGGVLTLAYIPRWFWRDHWGSPDMTELLTGRGVGNISSTYLPLTDDGVGWQPYGGVTPVIWQYADDQPFNGQAVDYNAYPGTVEQLRALFNGQPQGDEMQRFVQLKKDGVVLPPVYLTDGRMISYRWVQTPQEKADIIYWASPPINEIQLADDGKVVTVVERLELFGFLVGPSPDGTPPDSGIDLAAVEAAAAQGAKEGARLGIDGAEVSGATIHAAA
jgi:lysozyme